MRNALATLLERTTEQDKAIQPTNERLHTFVTETQQRLRGQSPAALRGRPRLLTFSTPLRTLVAGIRAPYPHPNPSGTTTRSNTLAGPNLVERHGGPGDLDDGNTRINEDEHLENGSNERANMECDEKLA